MINKFNENKEFNHFQDLSNQWWDAEGKFKILHSITPLRIYYIKKNVINRHKIKDKKKPLCNLDILDLGCGGGLACEPLARLGANVTGVDFIKKNIEVAKQHATKSNLNIQYTKNNLSSLNLKKKYDLILLLEVIEHLDNWKKTISKSRTLLKPKGRMIFSSINRTILSKILAIFLTEQILGWVPKNTHTYSKLIKPEELKSFIEKNKMKTIDITGLVFNPIIREWSLNKNKTRINYFLTAEKI